MKFVLQLWPDVAEDAPPEALLLYAIDSAVRNPELVWDIFDDNGNLLHADVSLAKGDSS